MAFANSVILYNCKLNHNGLFTCDFGGSGGTRDSVMGGTNSLATVKFTYSSCTYMRKDKYIMVDENADVLDAAGVNYCRYINTDFSSNHYFYAFVVNIEYIAPKTSRLTIETDCFTTYFDRIVPQQCIVEREHVADDRMWKNTMSEEPRANKFNYREAPTSGWNDLNLDYNYYGELCDNYYGYIYLSDLPDNWKENSISGVTVNLHNDGFINGVEPGGYAFVFEISQNYSKYIIAQLQADGLDMAALKEIGAFPKSAVSTRTPVFNPPRPYDVPRQSGPDIQLYTFNTTSSGRQISFTRPYTMNEIYTPNNRKLLQSPYTTYIFTNSAQQSQELEPELFASYQDGQVYFSAYQTGADTAQVIAIPKDYCGKPEDWAHAIASDTYLSLDAISNSAQQYKALNKNMLSRTVVNGLTSVVGSAVGLGLGALTGGLMGGVATKLIGGAIAGVGGKAGSALGMKIAGGVGNSVANQVYAGVGSAIGNTTSGILQGASSYYSGLKQAETAADQIVGSVNTPTMGYLADGGSRPRVFFKQACDAEARAIDSYFDRYGYNVYTAKTPQWNSRPLFNFVKTVGCNFAGEIPQSDKEILNSLFDNGITIWHNVGSYGTYDGANNLAPTR